MFVLSSKTHLNNCQSNYCLYKISTIKIDIYKQIAVSGSKTNKTVELKLFLFNLNRIMSNNCIFRDENSFCNMIFLNKSSKIMVKR